MKIAIVGKLRTGKDTLGDYLNTNYGGSLFAFGDQLKKDFHEEFTETPKDPKPRKGYQLFGQLKRYIHGEDYWLNKCFNEIERYGEVVEDYGKVYKKEFKFIPVITDVRQPNEVECCKQAGYIVIRTYADLATMIERAEKSGDIFDPEDLKHETEARVNDYEVHYELENNSTLESFYKQIDNLMEILKVEKI